MSDGCFLNFVTRTFLSFKTRAGASSMMNIMICRDSAFVLSLSQTRQPVFVQLLQAVFRVYHCNWLTPVQKGSVENCIKVLSDVGKNNTVLILTRGSTSQNECLMRP